MMMEEVATKQAPSAPLSLLCEVRKYAWGKKGHESTVAQLAAKGNPTFDLDKDTNYAELWMGTHPNAPSYVMDDGKKVTLASHLTANPHLMGTSVSADGQLPFLLKILSIDRMLSIQAHPDREHAQKLHASDPKNYKDGNHKPELCIALTPFQGLCGFRPLHEIQQHAKKYPEFAAVAGADAVKEVAAAARLSADDHVSMEIKAAALKAVFSGLMHADKDSVKVQLRRLELKLVAKGDAVLPVENYFLRIHEQYPGDVGCFCLFVMNIMELSVGEAMFLGPNVPHAYISGDCVECMACSDNVVRAGCTGKFKDVETLIGMLDYTPKPPEEQIFEPSALGKNVTVFSPPVPDFKVTMIKAVSSDTVQIDCDEFPAVLIVTAGEGALTAAGEKFELLSGKVFFLAAHTSHTLEATGSCPLICFTSSQNKKEE